MKSSDSCDWKSFFILKICINKILSIEIKSFMYIFWGPQSCKGIVSLLRITGLEFYLFCWDMKHMSNIRLRYRSFVIVVSVNTTNHKIEFATLVWLNWRKMKFSVKDIFSKCDRVGIGYLFWKNPERYSLAKRKSLRLRFSKVSWKFCIPTAYNFSVIYQ